MQKRNACTILVERLKERSHMGDLGIDKRIILQRILKRTGCDNVRQIELTWDMDRW
jgi:hypothetical protein